MIDEADDIVYYAYPHPDKNVMENNRMLGRVFGQKIIPVLKEKEYIKEVTNLDTILPFVNKYIHNMKKHLRKPKLNLFLDENGLFWDIFRPRDDLVLRPI